MFSQTADQFGFDEYIRRCIHLFYICIPNSSLGFDLQTVASFSTAVSTTDAERLQGYSGFYFNVSLPDLTTQITPFIKVRMWLCRVNNL
jgi:hypothetical protein